MISKAGATAALILAATFVTASCSGSGSSGSTSRQASSAVVTTFSSPSASQSTAAQPTTFTSATYRYTVTLPPGWVSSQAAEKWSVYDPFGLDRYSAQADQFSSPSDVVSFVVADHWKRGLAAWARYWIAATTRTHESCPPKPSTTNRVTVGNQRGTLLDYNCGILVNIAATVHHGVGYCFSFVDDFVHAATDPTDHATFLKMLKSVQFAD